MQNTTGKERHLNGTWEEFESWIRATLGAKFRWRVKPIDTKLNRQMIAHLLLEAKEQKREGFLKDNAFLEVPED